MGAALGVGPTLCHLFPAPNPPPEAGSPIQTSLLQLQNSEVSWQHAEMLTGVHLTIPCLFLFPSQSSSSCRESTEGADRKGKDTAGCAQQGCHPVSQSCGLGWVNAMPAPMPQPCRLKPGLRKGGDGLQGSEGLLCPRQRSPEHTQPPPRSPISVLPVPGSGSSSRAECAQALMRANPAQNEPSPGAH